MPESDELWLRMTRVLAAQRTEVFQALSDPEVLARWWGPRGFTVPSVELEPRVGGALRIEMQPPGGDRFHLAGEFREFEPPSRIAFTFRWEPPDPDDQETMARLSLEERGSETEVELSQGEFATEERRELHKGGWSDSFDRLEELLG